jgi:hypothetical protein
MRALRTKARLACATTFLCFPGDGRECRKCRGRIETVTIEVSVAEMRRLKALATMCGVSVDGLH